jgi:hypothetical protein
MSTVGLRFVAGNAHGVRRCFNDRFPHFLFDLGFLIWRGCQHKSLRSVHMPRTWAVARFAADHQQVLLRPRGIAPGFAEAGDMALQAGGIRAVLFGKMSERLGMGRLRPSIGLGTMANETLIRSDKGLLNLRCRRLISVGGPPQVVWRRTSF